MWIKHSCLIDIIFLLSHSRLDSKKLDIYHQIVHCGELKRQRLLTAGLNSAFVHEACDLDAGIVRKIGNESPVYNIAAYLIRNVCNDGFHNIRGIFLCALMRDLVVDIIIFLVLPVLYLLNAASRIFIERDIISLDKLGILCLDKKVIIFGVVLARLSAVIAETSYVLESHEVVMVRNAAFEHF